MHDYELYLLFFGVALLYASVGFGGGSSYLALLALYGVEFKLMRVTALLCNIVVVSGGTYIFYKKGLLDWKKVLPIVAVSVPMAYLGGRLPIKEQTFFLILAVSLFIAGLLMFFQKSLGSSGETEVRKNKPEVNAAIGGGIGFLSGMVGIGGGIFLAPLLHLMRWSAAKAIAATASFFILVNSIAGLIGQWQQPDFQWNWKFSIGLMVSVFLGGQIGSRLAADQFRQDVVRKMTAALVVFIAVRIFLKNLI